MGIAFDTLQAWLLIPKGFEAFLCLYSAYKIRKISQYVVNQLFSLAFILWAIYVTIDGFVFTFGAASPSIFNLAKVLFGIQLAIGAAYAYAIVSVTRVIKDSQEVFKQYKGKYLEILGLLIVMIIVGATMSLKVVDLETNTMIDPTTLPPPGEFRIVEVFSLSSALGTVIPFLIFFLSLFYLIKVIIRTEDQVIKKKMVILTIGVSFAPIGLLYFVLRAFLFPIYTFTTALVGHIFWILSPLLVLYTQSMKK